MKEEIKLAGLSGQETKRHVPNDTFLLGYMGSIAHGTYVPKTDPNSIDDRDIMGVCCAPPNVYLGLAHFEQLESKRGEYDSVVYEARKFFRLLLKQNPNVLGLLWLTETNYIHVSKWGKTLLENRDLFTSKQAYHSFVGYAHGQLHRMTHYKFEGYMGQKRKELVDRHGYDCKNAAHLIRLLRMGVEYLTDGQLQVFRQDADELKEIKAGKWDLGRVKAEAEKLFDLAREAYIRSPLPPLPQKEKAEELLMAILKDHLDNYISPTIAPQEK